MSSVRQAVGFHPMVHKEAEEVWIDLSELGLQGAGDNLEAAWEDLEREVRGYVARYLGNPELAASPNRKAHKAHVLAAQAADGEGKLAVVLQG